MFAFKVDNYVEKLIAVLISRPSKVVQRLYLFAAAGRGVQGGSLSDLLLVLKEK